MQVANVTKIGSQKKVVLAQGSPSEEALSRNLCLVITHQYLTYLFTVNIVINVYYSFEVSRVSD